MNTEVIHAILGLALTLSPEVWISLLLGAVVTVVIAFVIYRIQKKESSLHKQDHDARFDKLEQIHQQDSEKIRVLYELIVQSQKGSLGEIESAILEEKIEVAADKITEQDSDHAQALKAIAEKDKDEADDLLDKITQREHDLMEVYELRAMNEYRNGNYAQAVKWYRKIVELEPDNFESIINLADSLDGADLKQEARDLALKTFDALEKKGLLDDKKRYRLHQMIISSYSSIADCEKAEPYIFKNLEFAKQIYGGQSPQMRDVLTELGNLYVRKQQYKKSEEYYLQVLAIEKAGNIDDKSRILNNLAGLYRQQGRYQEALPLLDESLKFVSASLGESHPGLLYPLLNIANVYNRLGRFNEAEANYLKAKDIAISKLGVEHNLYFETMRSLAVLYNDLKRYEEADAIIRELIDIKTAKEGSESINVAALLHQLAVNYLNQEKNDEAEQILIRSLEIFNKVTSPENPYLLVTMLSFAIVQYRKGHYEEARQGLQKIIDTYHLQGKEDSYEMAMAHVHLSNVYKSLNQWEAAEQAMHFALLYFDEKSPKNPATVRYRSVYSDILLKLGRQAEADTYKSKAESLKVTPEGN